MGIVRHVLSNRIVKKNIVTKIKAHAIHTFVMISIGINQDSGFIVEAFLINMFDVAFMARE